jgi:hypothetical protein
MASSPVIYNLAQYPWWQRLQTQLTVYYAVIEKPRNQH